MTVGVGDFYCEMQKVHYNFCCAQMEYLSITGYFSASVTEALHRIVSQSVPQHEDCKLYLGCLNNFNHGGVGVGHFRVVLFDSCKM